MIINADMDAIVKLANYVDQYDSQLRSMIGNLNSSFSQMGSSGGWSDEKYQVFSQSQMAKLTDDIDFLLQVIDNDLRPFLAEYYRRLRDYQQV